jgi:glycosyltransferase involved in cell wall biosynthesis
MAAPSVSVVTPFFNTAPYLGECIESVLAQSHGDFEYILVDNQSDDGSSEIAAAYCRKDSRLVLIRTGRFLTQVQNYNFALTRMSPQSRYCKMVQADDWIYPRCLSEMVALAERHPAVAIVGSYRLRGAAMDGTGLPPETQVLSGREACRRHLLDNLFLFGSPTSLLFRADVVRSRRPFYSENRLHEDTEAVYEILARADFGFVHQVLSYTRVQQDSITGSTDSFNPDLLDFLIIMRRYGLVHLTPGEYYRRLKRVEDKYYRFLAEAWLARRGRSFWDYHRKGLASMGQALAGGRLAGKLPRVLVRTLLDPDRSLIAARVSGRRARTKPGRSHLR